MDKSSVNGVPSEEMKEALTRMSIEFEKAFNVAAKQVQIAFKTAKENMQKAMYKEPLVCSDCGEKNPSNAAYCHKCGHGLLSVQDSTKQNENPAQDSNAS